VRSKIVIVIIFIFFLILVYRVYSLSVISYEKYDELAKKNKERVIPIVPIRGIIFDRNNNPVAYNELRFNIALSPHLKKDELKSKLLFLKNIFPDINETKLSRIYKIYNSPYNHKPITLIEYVDENTIYKIEPFLSLDDDFFIIPSYLRKYPYKEVLSNVLGYVSRASVNDLKKNKVIELTQISGKRGVEKYYDNLLQGKAGEKKVIVNAKNKILKIISIKKPTTHNLTLSIDTKLQKFIYDLLEKENKKGAVIVMRLNGEILALVSYPSYDNNLFVKGISQSKWNKLLFNIYHPLLNKPISGLYPPGSTVKPAEGLIAAASGKWNPWKKINCPGYIEIGGRKFRDWRSWGHGKTDLIKAIKRSVDTYYYQLGLKLGIDYLAKNLKRMGFGEKTGIDLPNEKRGIVPNKEWKIKKYHQPWFIGETLNAVIGQGYFLTTPFR
jgi:penicillin-binding protein 2